MNKIYIYTRFQRIWHWSQMILMLALLVTGFTISGTISFIDYNLAAKLHDIAGILWLSGFCCFWFWMAVTDDWRQYIPTAQKLFAVVHYYAWGIFNGKKHPYPKTKEARHNPLQRLVYLTLISILLPVQGVSGILYLLFNYWDRLGLGFLKLETIAMVHTTGAFAVIAFLIVHIYMTTTGESVTGHVKSMVTGWEKHHSSPEARS